MMTDAKRAYAREYHYKASEATHDKHPCPNCGRRLRTSDGKAKHIRLKHPEATI
jgi:predicted RNA-binding Zn-ribbon protein involved in translation (DUF1610 family)